MGRKRDHMCMWDLWNTTQTHMLFSTLCLIDTAFISSLHSWDDETLHILCSSLPCLLSRLEDTTGNLSLSLIHSPLHVEHKCMHDAHTETVYSSPLACCVAACLTQLNVSYHACHLSCNNSHIILTNGMCLSSMTPLGVELFFTHSELVNHQRYSMKCVHWDMWCIFFLCRLFANN